MPAKYILAALACVFFLAALRRISRDRGARHPQTRTWLTVSLIFASVSAWLFYTT